MDKINQKTFVTSGIKTSVVIVLLCTFQLAVCSCQSTKSNSGNCDSIIKTSKCDSCESNLDGVISILCKDIGTCTYNDSFQRNSQGMIDLFEDTFKDSLFKDVQNAEYCDFYFLGKNESSCINIEIWHSPSELITDGIMNDLEKLPEVTVRYLPSINWIFIQSGNTVYYVSSEEYSISDTELQLVKSAVLSSLPSKSHKPRTIEFEK